jgi:hypothetical protein
MILLAIKMQAFPVIIRESPIEKLGKIITPFFANRYLSTSIVGIAIVACVITTPHHAEIDVVELRA